MSTSTTTSTRRQWIMKQSTIALGGIMMGGSTTIPTTILTGPIGEVANAAPPIAVIAEELGYFPVTDRATGNVMYIPKRVKRTSTPQAIELANKLKDNNIYMYGTYWCPHCSRQKEVFGKEAWDVLLANGNYVECAPKGYGYNPKRIPNDIDGYPTFRDIQTTSNNNKGKSKTGKLINRSGEVPLDVLAQLVGYDTFDPTLEDPVPLVGTPCKLR